MSALPKQLKLEQVKHLLLMSPEGVEMAEIIKLLEMDQSSAWRYLMQLGARKLERGLYTLVPTKDDEDLAVAVLARNFMTVADAAFELGVTSNYVRQLIEKGRLRADRIGPRRWAIRRTDFEAFRIEWRHR